MERFVFFFFAVTLLIVSAFAKAEEPISTEVERWSLIQRVLNKQQFYLRSSDERIPPGFCTQMLKDLTSKAGVEVIEPVVKTNDPNSAELKGFRDCAEHWNGRPPPKGGLESLDQIGQVGFRLYRIDLDGNPANGLELVIAADIEKGRHMLDDSANAIGFSQVDLNSCTLRGGAPVYMPGDLGVLIRYKGYYRVVELVPGNEDGGIYWVRAWNFDANKKDLKSALPCAWNTERNP